MYFLEIYVDIDVSRLNLFGPAISRDGEVLIEPFQFTNDTDGFYLLSSNLSSFLDVSLIIDLKFTAYYGNNLVH